MCHWGGPGRKEESSREGANTPSCNIVGDRLSHESGNRVVGSIFDFLPGGPTGSVADCHNFAIAYGCGGGEHDRIADDACRTRADRSATVDDNFEVSGGEGACNDGCVAEGQHDAGPSPVLNSRTGYRRWGTYDCIRTKAIDRHRSTIRITVAHTNSQHKCMCEEAREKHIDTWKDEERRREIG